MRPIRHQADRHYKGLHILVGLQSPVLMTRGLVELCAWSIGNPAEPLAFRLKLSSESVDTCFPAHLFLSFLSSRCLR
jgi:hypothetical protein